MVPEGTPDSEPSHEAEEHNEETKWLSDKELLDNWCATIMSLVDHPQDESSRANPQALTSNQAFI